MPEDEKILSLTGRTTDFSDDHKDARIAALEVENEMLRGKLGYGSLAGSLRIKDISRESETLWKAVLDERSVRDFGNKTDMLIEGGEVYTVVVDSASSEAVALGHQLILIDRFNNQHYFALAVDEEKDNGELTVLCFEAPVFGDMLKCRLTTV